MNVFDLISSLKYNYFFFLFSPLPLLKIHKEYVILLKEVFLILSQWDYWVIEI